MAPPDDNAQAVSPFSIGSVYPAEPGATDPALAKEFLAQHRADMMGRQGDINATLGSMQTSTDQLAKILDDTTAAIKASRQGQSNLPLMAMAAGLLSSRGNFGQQLGAGLSSVIPTVQKDREQDQQMQMQLAGLALKKAAIEQGPLEAKLAYYKALQTGDITAARAIEQALIRAQGGTNAANNPKLIQKTVQDALTEARKQVDSMGKEMYATAEEREAEIRRRFAENIKVAKSSGIPIPDDVLTQVMGGQSAVPSGTGPSGTGMMQRKTYFDQPTPDKVKQLQDQGLPPPPTAYVYDSVGPLDKPKILQAQIQQFNKETKDYDATSAQQRTLLDQLGQMEQILNKNPGIVGPQRGIVPNRYAPNLSSDAQTLSSLMQALQLHSIPKGQGAVSDMERRLFENSGPNMNANAGANKDLINIGREIVKRDIDKREFFNQYFTNYRTTDGMVQAWDKYINSPAGEAFTRGPDGSLKVNQRTPWREYFRNEGRDAGNRAKGGYIKLGDEYDE